NICDAALFQDGLWSIRVQFPEPYIFQIQYGKKGDLPVPGRYSGKNFKEIAIYRPSSGLWAINNLTRIYFGENGDIVVPADYNGNGTTDPAVYRSDEKLWAVRNITRVNFTGSGEMIPIPFDYQGDGTDNIARFNNTLGLWSIRSHTRIYFGAPGDLPVSGPDIKENKREKNTDPAIPHFLQE
ncbi:MAG: hypothetical protein U9N73_06755, partial [Candidatus Auribacterota bacterium]|nr:hypothetical protein [Candidatus Auribacterota bacterium]